MGEQLKIHCRTQDTGAAEGKGIKNNLFRA
jgi:hypothetical protein